MAFKVFQKLFTAYPITNFLFASFKSLLLTLEMLPETLLKTPVCISVLNRRLMAFEAGLLEAFSKLVCNFKGAS